MTATDTPGGLYAISTATRFAEAERRKQERLDLLPTRRAVYVRRGQGALQTRPLAADTATVDDLAAVVGLAPGIAGRRIDAALGPSAIRIDN